ncbi:type II toxin-antitoxin system RelE/ParE family toxin [Methylomagnum sp.]
MNQPISFHRTAQAEFNEAATWYEAQRTGLGLEFIAEVDRCITLIAENPHQYAVLYREVRRAIVRRFPYNVFFRIEPRGIRILAVFHARRNPAVWQKRT